MCSYSDNIVRFSKCLNQSNNPRIPHSFLYFTHKRNVTVEARRGKNHYFLLRISAKAFTQSVSKENCVI